MNNQGIFEIDMQERPAGLRWSPLRVVTNSKGGSSGLKGAGSRAIACKSNKAGHRHRSRCGPVCTLQHGSPPGVCEAHVVQQLVQPHHLGEARWRVGGQVIWGLFWNGREKGSQRAGVRWVWHRRHTSPHVAHKPRSRRASPLRRGVHAPPTCCDVSSLGSVLGSTPPRISSTTRPGGCVWGGGGREGKGSC